MGLFEFFRVVKLQHLLGCFFTLLQEILSTKPKSNNELYFSSKFDPGFTGDHMLITIWILQFWYLLVISLYRRYICLGFQTPYSLILKIACKRWARFKNWVVEMRDVNTWPQETLYFSYRFHNFYGMNEWMNDEFIVFHHYYMQPFKCVKVQFKATFSGNKGNNAIDHS